MEEKKVTVKKQSPKTDYTEVLVSIAASLQLLVAHLESIALVKACDHKPNHIYRACSNCGVYIKRPEPQNGKK